MAEVLPNMEQLLSKYRQRTCALDCWWRHIKGEGNLNLIHFTTGLARTLLYITYGKVEKDSRFTSNMCDKQQQKSEPDRINVVFLCDEWKSSRGGISTFNREFAIHLAKFWSFIVNVYCYVFGSSDQDREDARNNNVNLITAKRVPGSTDPMDSLKIPPPGVDVDVVVGNGRKFGVAAYFIAHFTSCKWVQFIHVNCEDNPSVLRPNKTKEMFQEADLVALPSRAEGFGLIALEAISARKPVLISSQAGISVSLGKVKGGSDVIVASTEPQEWAKKITELSSQISQERHGKALHLRENYREVYGWKKETEKFITLVKNLSCGGDNVSDKENTGVKKSLKIKSKQDQSWTKAGPQPDRTPLGEVQNKKRKVHDKEIGKSLDQIPQAAKRLPSRKDVCTFCS